MMKAGPELAKESRHVADGTLIWKKRSSVALDIQVDTMKYHRYLEPTICIARVVSLAAGALQNHVCLRSAGR